VNDNSGDDYTTIPAYNMFLEQFRKGVHYQNITVNGYT